MILLFKKFAPKLSAKQALYLHGNNLSKLGDVLRLQADVLAMDSVTG